MKRLLAEEAPANVARFTLDGWCAAYLRPQAAPLPRPAGAVLSTAVWPPTDSCGPPQKRKGAAAPCSPSPATSRTTPWGGHPDPTGPGGRSWHEKKTILGPPRQAAISRAGWTGPALGLLVRGSCPTIDGPPHHLFYAEGHRALRCVMFGDAASLRFRPENGWVSSPPGDQYVHTGW